MADPTIEQFTRVHEVQHLRSDFFRRFQRYLRDEIQPKLDEYDALKEENAQLRAQLVKPAKKAPAAV